MTHTLVDIVMRLFIALLVLTMGLPPVPAVAAPVESELAVTVPLLNFLSAWIGRDQTYENAETFIAERNQYYDGLRDTLRTRFGEYVQGTLSNDPDVPKINRMRDSQVAAYIIQAALIESQRTASLKFAEAVKKGAKRNFDQALKREIQNRVMATGMMQQVFGAIQSGLGASQVMINRLNDRLDQVPEIDLDLRRLRTLSDQLRLSLGILNGPGTNELTEKLAQLSARLRNEAGISRADLQQVSDEIGTFRSRLQALSAVDVLEISGGQVAADLGMQILGFSPGTPATQAILNLLGRRAGVSYEQIRVRGMALLAAGDKARCQEKASAILRALQALAAEQNQEVTIQTPESLCNEINAERLRSNEPPEAVAGAEPIDPENAPFTEDNCSCGELMINRAHPWGSSSLDCGYGDGAEQEFRFEINYYNENHIDEIAPDYQSQLEGFQNRLDAVKETDTANVFLDEPNQSYYGMVITSPNGDGEMCATGAGSYLYAGRYLITTHMAFCDQGGDPQAYVEAMQMLADCAMAAVDGKYP